MRASVVVTLRRSRSASRPHGTDVRTFDGVAPALAAARAAADAGDLILVTGSLYTVADARRAIGV